MEVISKCDYINSYWMCLVTVLQTTFVKSQSLMCRSDGQKSALNYIWAPHQKHKRLSVLLIPQFFLLNVCHMTHKMTIREKVISFIVICMRARHDWCPNSAHTLIWVVILRLTSCLVFCYFTFDKKFVFLNKNKTKIKLQFVLSGDFILMLFFCCRLMSFIWVEILWVQQMINWYFGWISWAPKGN